jgi:hypothetical protein
VDRARLLQSVDEHWASTAAHLPRWPDPYPDRTRGPLDEEYSRCLDPGKYRILADAGIQALLDRRLAAVHDEPRLTGRFRQALQRPAGRALRVTPTRPGALPVLAHLETMVGVPDAAMVLATEAPFVQVCALPECGCDACDNGSAALLGELDEWLLALVTGDFVHIETEHGSIRSAGPPGWQASGAFPRTFDIEAAVREARAGDDRHLVVRGCAWSP